MKNYFDKKFELGYFAMNKYGVASPLTILTLLEETAADHCHDIDYCLYNLKSQNIGWVLTAGSIDMIRYPKYKEEILIRTWLSKYTLVRGYRENIIYDNWGNIIGRAKGIWVYYDIEKRKPAPIFDEIKIKWGTNPEISQEFDTEKIKVLNDAANPLEHQQEYDIHKSDVDNYKHVNNIRYFHWLIESIPDEILDNYFLKRINARFFSEAIYGEKIRVYNKNEADDSGAQKEFLHTMRSNKDERLLAAAHTLWERK
ncbi:MAG: thioesterase [Treponema sp.]|nr:thioesterase [Treponema sp.]